ncbi:transglutaminase-like cysteine peptidase [Erythrobacter sp. sf7]|uniref:Transglutaminase-like cysteine peptidase n=1 Tax=Erythrobacter fulvus TaxID=2987523 RepID=A0ABT5JQA5_9SPHN|nr:transglutaminase-like cysteine peptidase [Erythrobacter fulvus]MDC8754957.1 transglutaminase-like cysteine peptidase [Erythrobacter fulvus]
MAAPATVTGIGADKASAILGGQPSALELISMQQADILQPAGSAELSAFSDVEQAPQALNATNLMCPWGSLAPVTVREELSDGRDPASDDFLGSSRVYIGFTPLDDEWRRVSEKSSARSVRGLVARHAQESDFDHLARVNAWVNRKIEFVEDQTLYGMSEYWATAAETLRLSKGDCEDFAILKYQILVDSGVDPGSIYLTLVWDAIRRRDHAVLIVRLEDAYYMLDSDSDRVLPADTSYEYAARMSFSQRSAWVHGYTTKPDEGRGATTKRLAYFSDSAVSNAFATGFNK